MTNRSAQKASERLRAITPAQVTAWKTAAQTDPVSARALLALVLEVSAHDSPDVQEHAAITAASYLTGATDARMAARAAVVNARVTVALAGEAAAWDLYGDMTEEVTEGWDMGAHSTVSQWGTAPADAITRTRPADVTDAAVASVDGARRVSLARAVEDMRAHDEETCDRCHPGAGRRVSLTGITAHVEGWDGSDSAYHASRRHTVAALASVDPDGVLSAMGGAPLADRPRPSKVTGGDRTPRTTEHATPGGMSRDLPAVTVAREVSTHAGDILTPGGDPFRAETRLMRALSAHAASPRLDENGYRRSLNYGATAYAVDGARAELRAALALARANRPAPVTVREVRTLAPVAIVRPDMPPVSVVTVTRDGVTVTRDMSDSCPDGGCARCAESGPDACPRAESVALARVARADEARHAGEEYGVTSAPYASAQADTFGNAGHKSWVDTGEGATPAVSPNARVRSHKVPVSPRKRAAGNTGPTVPARLSH